jgi:hypothetical protein
MPALFCLALKSQLTCDILHGGLWFLVMLHVMAVILILLSLISLFFYSILLGFSLIYIYIYIYMLAFR